MKKTTNKIKSLFLSFFYKHEIETEDGSYSEPFIEFFGQKKVDKVHDSIKGRLEDILFKGKGSWERDAGRIQIAQVIRILGELKKKGCNYVEIMYHTDHDSYVFNGLEVRESTPEEVEKYMALKEEGEKVEKQIEELHKQGEKLREDYHKKISKEGMR